MAAKALNIEFGKRITKVCVSEKKGKSFAITDSFTFPTPDGAVVDGQIVSEISLGDALKEQLADREITADQAYFTVTSTKIASRDVSLPSVKDDQIKNICLTNAADYFPVDIEKYTIDSVLLERLEDECKVMVVACPNVIVESYIALADYMNISIAALDFSSNSQHQVLKSIGGENVNMFVNIDADTTSVLFTEEGKLLMQRSLAFGGDEFICRYMGMKEMEEFKYLTALDNLTVSAEKTEIEDDVTELASSLEKLASSISRSQDFFVNSNPEKTINRVVLMGSCSHLIGIKEQIAQALGIDTVWLEEVEDIQGLANSISDISVYIGCLGARLAPMNFLPAEYVKKHGRSNSTVNGENFGYVAIAAAALIIAVLLGIPGIKGIIYANKLSKVETQIADLEYAQEEYDTYIKYTNGQRDLDSYVAGSISNNKNLRAFFEELEEKMPSDINVLSASCTPDSVNLNVTVPSFKEAAAVLRQLRSFNSIDVISVGGFTEAGDAGATLVSFSLNCTYVPYEVQAEAAAAQEAPAEEAPAEETTEG